MNTAAITQRLGDQLAAEADPIERPRPAGTHARVVVTADDAAADWNAYVERHDQATAYHNAAWKGVIERTFGHATRYLLARVDNQTVGALPLVVFKSRLFGRFVVSIPFVNYGGMLASSSEAADALLESAIEIARNEKASYLELRHRRQLFPELPSKRHKVAMILSLERTSDEQWRALDRKVRNQVRKAEKCDLRSTRGGVELLPQFYAVFARNMRDLGTPVYSIDFFREVLTTFPNSSSIFCVSLGDLPIAASLVLWHQDVLEVPWASSIRDYNSRCPNVLLYWQMVQFGIEKGFTRFDLGRSTPHEGTYDFKRQWGAEPHPLVWEYWTEHRGNLPDLSPRNPRYKRVIQIWQRLPLALTRAIGPHIVRSIP